MSNMNGDEKPDAANFNSETPRSALFMKYIAQDNTQPYATENVQPEVLPVKSEINDDNTSALESKNSNESLLPENSESVIPSNINNTIAAKKNVQNMSIFKDQLSGSGF